MMSHFEENRFSTKTALQYSWAYKVVFPPQASTQGLSPRAQRLIYIKHNISKFRSRVDFQASREVNTALRQLHRHASITLGPLGGTMFLLGYRAIQKKNAFINGAQVGAVSLFVSVVRVPFVAGTLSTLICVVSGSLQCIVLLVGGSYIAITTAFAMLTHSISAVISYNAFINLLCFSLITSFGGALLGPFGHQLGLNSLLTLRHIDFLQGPIDEILRSSPQFSYLKLLVKAPESGLKSKLVRFAASLLQLIVLQQTHNLKLFGLGFLGQVFSRSTQAGVTPPLVNGGALGTYYMLSPETVETLRVVFQGLSGS